MFGRKTKALIEDLEEAVDRLKTASYVNERDLGKLERRVGKLEPKDPHVCVDLCEWGKPEKDGQTGKLIQTRRCKTCGMAELRQVPKQRRAKGAK